MCWSAFDEVEVMVPEGAQGVDFKGKELAGRQVILTAIPIHVVGSAGRAWPLLSAVRRGGL